MKIAKLSALLAVALYLPCASSQTMYKCGSTYSQTPCGAGQVEKSIPSGGGACQDESTKYSSACLDQTIRDAPKEAAKLREQLLAKLPDTPPAPEVIEKNKARCESAVKSQLKDPESARIKELSRSGAGNDYFNGKVTPRVHYYVTVNAKNSYGGYTGDKLWNCVFSLDEKELLRTKELNSTLSR